MGYKFTPALCLFSALLAAPVVLAQGTFVIQLGSFPSKQEAEQKWDTIKKSQPDVTNGLSMQVSEAILQPDNVTLYRTQAGPFKSKIDAQTACSKLKGKSECFVVETAMFAPAPATEQMAAKPAEPVALPTLDSEKPAGLAPLPLPPELPPAGTVAKPAVTSTAVAMADPTPTPTAKAAPLASTPTVMTEKSESSWFSWIKNPFSSDKEEKTEEAKPATPQAPAAIAAAPIAPVEQAAAPAPTPATPTNRPGQTIFYAAADQKPADVKPWTPSTRIEPAASGAAPQIAAGASATTTTTTTQTTTSSLLKPAPLPPLAPPATAATVPAPVAPPPAVATPIPAADFPVTAGAKPITIRAKTPVVAQPKVMPEGAPKVKVAEAIRVPLSSNKKRLVTSANPASFKSMPSQNLGLRSYWAQLGFFPDDRSALDFWQSFSASLPEFYNVRVRVVKPYLTRGRAARTSLRVGPFADADSIARLCNTASSRGLRCTTVEDLGSSTVANAPRNREAVPLKYQSAREEGVSGHWIQLGTYRSASEAEAMWDQLRDSHSDLLKRVGSKVATPALSSSANAKYRLRAGPFANAMAANNLCRQLKFRGVNCLAISGN